MDRKIKVLFVFTANQYNVLNEMLWKLAYCLEQKHDIWLENIGWTIMR